MLIDKLSRVSEQPGQAAKSEITNFAKGSGNAINLASAILDIADGIEAGVDANRVSTITATDYASLLGEKMPKVDNIV